VKRKGLVPALLALSLVGCTCGSSTPATEAGPKLLEPLAAESWLVELPLTGFGPALAAVPLGAREPRPIVIALHGGFDRPEWACGTWTGIVEARAFVLCPRGAKKKDRYGWGSSEDVQKELRAALAALKQRFGAHVDTGPVVLTAFAAATPLATEIARQEPEFFQKLVLTGVERDAWSAGHAGVYAKRGGQRVLFVCSDPECEHWAERYLMFTKGAGSWARLADVGDFGRQLDARVATAIRKEIPWLVTGDTRFGSLAEKD
jgi:hypothetical protein